MTYFAGLSFLEFLSNEIVRGILSKLKLSFLRKKVKLSFLLGAGAVW
jgi:hypothetical protein